MIADDETLARLRHAWGAGWRIWRSRRDHDRDGERTGAWMASRIVDAAGVVPTVVTDTAAELNQALQHQALMAHAVRRLLGALRGACVLADPAGPKIVQAVHPLTARRETVLLRYSHRHDGLAWYWLRDYETELIGTVDDLELITREIVHTISGPRTATRASAWPPRGLVP